MSRYATSRSPGLWTLTIGSLALSAAVSSCVTSPLDRIPGVVEDVTQDDIPVPRDFVQRPRGDNWAYIQYSEGSARFRSWVGEYVGFKQIRDLVPWYKTQMMKDGWTHQGTQEGDKRILTFTNLAEEQAKVILDRQYNPYEDRFETVVRVELGPVPTENMSVEEVLRRADFDGEFDADAPAGSRALPTGSPLGEVDPLPGLEADESNDGDPASGEPGLPSGLSLGSAAAAPAAAGGATTRDLGATGEKTDGETAGEAETETSSEPVDENSKPPEPTVLASAEATPTPAIDVEDEASSVDVVPVSYENVDYLGPRLPANLLRGDTPDEGSPPSRTN